MVTNSFVNRDVELGFLEGRYISGKFEFVPVYGRRRMGKTELILQFVKNKKAIYFLATAGTKKENIERFKAAAKHVIDLSAVKNDWEAVLEYIKKDLQGRAVIVIDEFPYLVETEKGLSSIFQAAIDGHLRNSRIFLILAGSSLGMMYREVLAYKAPLYGRRTGQIHLKELTFKDSAKFFNKPLEEVIKIYAICGGMPAYLREFTEKKPFFQLVEQKILRRDAVLREEVPFLLRQELRDPKVYMAILAAISLGYRNLGKIINYCGFPSKTGIMPYLRTLETLDYTRRQVPITETPRSKKGLYFITDNFFNFWFRFVRKNLDLIEQDVKEGVKEIKKEFNTYVGFIFEDVCEQFLWEQREVMPAFTKIGRWWHRGEEIDRIALNEKERNILFIECKWQEGIDAERVLSELKEKAGHVPWNRDARKEYYVLFAKSYKKKVADKHVSLFDLGDLEGAFHQL